jgi:hypothetical protein
LRRVPIADARERAGYKQDDGIASKLASHPEIQVGVKEITGKAAAKAGITALRIFEELGRFGFTNILDYMRVFGCGHVLKSAAEMG